MGNWIVVVTLFAALAFASCVLMQQTKQFVPAKSWLTCENAVGQIIYREDGTSWMLLPDGSWYERRSGKDYVPQLGVECEVIWEN